MSYTLGGPDASSFDIGLTSGQITVGAGTMLDYETKTSYMVTVIATDSFGATASIPVTITVTGVNEGPDVTGPARTDYPENGEGAVATFTATDPENAGAITWSIPTGDPDGDGDLTVADNVDSALFEIDPDSGVLTFAEVPDYEMPADDDPNNEYTVTVVATDADGVMTNKAFTVEVTNVDEAGTVTLDKVAPYPGEALTATHSDLDGGITGAEWQWSKSRSKSGSYNAIEDAKAATYSPVSGDVGFYLRATVTYTDGHDSDKSAMATSAHTVQAINLPNNPPVFPDQDPDMVGDQSTAAARMVEENTAAGEDVGAPVAAEDADNDILTYTLDDTARETFDIDQATGQIKTKDALDEDTTATYTVTVTATDPAGDDDMITVTITVTGVNEPPDITGEVGAYDENGSDDVAAFTARDPEGETPAPTFDLTGADAALFTFTGGVLTFKTSPNYEDPKDAGTDNTYELTVGARDADGIRGTRDIEVKVTNEDEAGTVTLSAVQPRVGVSLTASLTDIDGPVSGVTWQWSADGSVIDDAKSDTYTPVATDVGATLKATAMYTDPQGAEKDAEVDSATVAADTRNKAPVFGDQDGDDTNGIQNTEAERTVAENTVAPNPVNGGAVTATDPNTAALQDTVSYKLGGTDASSFDIGLTTGQITVATGTELDYETKTSYMVTVIATDSFGATASIPVTITVTDINEGPEVSLGGLAISGMRSITRAEDDSALLATYTSTGPESASTMWSLSGADADDFTIAGGVLAFSSTPDFESPADADGDNVYELAVKATDGTYTAAPWDVTVMVTNVEEDGVVTLSADPQVGVELTASLADPDGNVSGMAWQWAREDGVGGFEDIVGAASAAYSPGADDEGNLLRATVTYTDGEGADKSAEATSAAVEPEAADCGTAEGRYDTNDNGIEKSEVLAAINDYLFGVVGCEITKSEVLELINLYLFG